MSEYDDPLLNFFQRYERVFFAVLRWSAITTGALAGIAVWAVTIRAILSVMAWAVSP